MKRLLVAALVVAGCASQTPQEPPLPDGMVTLATFTADVDLSAGTFAIRAKPTEAGTRAGFGSLVVSEVTVGNDGAAWNNSTDDHGCGSEPYPATWGAVVKVTSLLGSPTSLGGVYAEITDFGGGAGNRGCNSVTAAPTGLSNTYGLWSYGTILSEQSASTSWTFHYVSAAQFSFSGRIVAAKVDAASGLPLVYRGEQSIGNNGTNIVYSSDEDPQLQFVNFDGTDGGVSISLPGYATAIAPDVTDGLIWFITEAPDETVGYVDSAGAGMAWVLDAVNTELGGLAPDPAVPGKAWYRSGTGGYIRSVEMGLPAPVLGTPIPTDFTPHGLAFGPGPDAKLFVTAPADDTVMVFSGSGEWEDNIATPPGCLGPTSILLGPDGQLWFTAAADNAVCKMTVAGAFTPIAIEVDGPGQLASDGTNVWVTGATLNEVVRIDPAGPGYRIGLPFGSGAFGLAAGGGYLWASSDLFKFRIQP